MPYARPWSIGLAAAVVLASLTDFAPAQLPQPAGPAPTATVKKPDTVSQSPTRPAYKPVPLIPPKGWDDPSFATFRQRVATIAKGRVYGELSKIVDKIAFFWERDFNGEFDPNRDAVENLAAAVRLESNDGAGWNLLAVFAAEASVSPIPSRAGTICAPGRPSYDEVEFDWLTDRTHTAGLEWTYPRSDGVPVRSAPRQSAPTIETLGLNFVRVLPDRPGNRAAGHSQAAWVRIATPAGKVGFVAPGSLLSLYAERLCYAKDVTGLWHIVGFVGM